MNHKPCIGAQVFLHIIWRNKSTLSKKNQVWFNLEQIFQPLGEEGLYTLLADSMLPFRNSGKEQRSDSGDGFQSGAVLYIPDLLVGNPNQRFLKEENKESAT